MMLRIVDIAMIAGLENDIVKSNIERVLFVLQKHVTFLFKRTSAYDCRVDCMCERWFEKARVIIDDATVSLFADEVTFSMSEAWRPSVQQ